MLCWTQMFSMPTLFCYSKENFPSKYFSFQVVSISWPLQFSTSLLVWDCGIGWGFFSPKREALSTSTPSTRSLTDQRGGASYQNVLNLVCFFSQISANYIEVFKCQWDPAPNLPFCFDSNLLVVASPSIENWTMPSHWPLSGHGCWRRINTVLFQRRALLPDEPCPNKFCLRNLSYKNYLTYTKTNIHALDSRQMLADIALLISTCAGKLWTQKSAVTLSHRSEVVACGGLAIVIF